MTHPLTSDLHLLLAAIGDEPGDTSPVGALADLLLMDDDETTRKWGGWIAAELELESLPPTVDTTDHCPNCGRSGFWRNGVHFEHEKICLKDGCGITWEPGETIPNPKLIAPRKRAAALERELVPILRRGARCERCGGSGKAYPFDEPPFEVFNQRPCPTCSGRGWLGVLSGETKPIPARPWRVSPRGEYTDEDRHFQTSQEVGRVLAAHPTPFADDWHYKLDWRYGLPHRLHCTLAEWMEQKSEWRFGNGSLGQYHDWHPTPFAAAVLAEWACIAEVQITDRGYQTCHLYSESETSDLPTSENVPHPLFTLLWETFPKKRNHGGIRWLMFDSSEAATSAIARSARQWARREMREGPKAGRVREA